MADNNVEPVFCVSTIPVKPENTEAAHKAFQEIADLTKENEPGALMYRFYKIEGKDEFVWIEKFESKEAYDAHVKSDHIQSWAKKYMASGLFDGSFTFNFPSKGLGVGGFDKA